MEQCRRQHLEQALIDSFISAKNQLGEGAPTFFIQKFWQSLAIYYIGILPDTSIGKILDIHQVAIVSFRKTLNIPRGLIRKGTSKAAVCSIKLIRKNNLGKFHGHNKKFTDGTVSRGKYYYYSLRDIQIILTAFKNFWWLHSSILNEYLRHHEVFLANRTIRKLRSEYRKYLDTKSLALC